MLILRITEQDCAKLKIKTDTIDKLMKFLDGMKKRERFKIRPKI